jgi:hypothetical protein
MAGETPDRGELEAALRTLARFVAPFVRELLDDEAGPRPSQGGRQAWDSETAEEFVNGLSPELLLRGADLFKKLNEPPHSVDSVTLADLVGVSGRQLSGQFLRPLRTAAEALGLPEPWTSSRVAPRGKLAARTLLQADGDVATVLHEAFERRAPSPPGPEAAKRQKTDVPRPSAVFVYRPEYATGLDEAKDGWSSCLRDSAPGSRAVVYQALVAQAVVSLFDVEGQPEWDNEFGWMCWGRFIPIKPAISREELLGSPALDAVFLHIQGRRRLPADAQVALANLIEDSGQALPPHSLTVGPSHQPRRKGRRRQG